jgi:hypothetical protein
MTTWTPFSLSVVLNALPSDMECSGAHIRDQFSRGKG